MTARADGHPTLQTPRMSPKEYNMHKESITQSLSAYFGPENIICHTEAPGKTDHGDIDIDISYSDAIDWAKVAHAIGAAAYLDRGSEKSQKCSFAMRLDGQPSAHPPICYTFSKINDRLNQKTSPDISEEAYVQVDLEKNSPELKAWTAFYGSYGDLAGMLGNSVTNFGFDVTDRGLRLRLVELDESGRGEWEHFQLPLEEGRMMLSSDPRQVMEFFGLDAERYYAGFETELEMFEWLAQCRMISEYSLKRERNEISRDRQKAGRPMFTRFFKEWLPRYPEEKKDDGGSRAGMECDIAADYSLPTPPSPPNETPDSTNTPIASPSPPIDSPTTGNDDRSSAIAHLRAEYLIHSLTFFAKRPQYISLHSRLLRKRANSTVSHKIRSILAATSQKKGPKLAELVRAFRRNVSYGEGGPVILEEGRGDDESELWTFLDEGGRQFRDKEGVERWVGENFERVKEVERGRGKGRQSNA